MLFYIYYGQNVYERHPY